MLYLDIFKKEYIEQTPTSGITTSRDIDYLRRLYVFNKDAIGAYYQERNFSVKNTNILSRLVEHFPIYLGRDVYQFLDATDERLTYLGKSFRFTSALEKGVMHPPYFFGNEGEEVIIAGTENFDAIAHSVKWKTADCVRILNHPRNDSRSLLPLGYDDGGRGGRASVYIDLPKLAVKYREFMRANASAAEGEAVLTKNHFVIKYVLPTTIPDIIDHGLLNRIMDSFYGRPVVEPKRKYAFKIYEPTTQLNRYVQDTLDVIHSKPMDFVNMLRHIKLAFATDASSLLSLPDLSSTRQVQPAILATRIDHMVFMLDVAKSMDMNRHFLNDWKRYAARMLADNSLGDFFSYETEKDIKGKLYRLRQL